MSSNAPVPEEPGLRRDLGALRRYFWLPIATVGIAVIAALAMGAMTSSSGEARFRENVAVDALPPLFGPPVLPSPFDYARLATGDGVVGAVAAERGRAPESVRGQLRATASLNRPEIDFIVTGEDALATARAWQRAFNDATVAQTPDLERLLVIPYARQLDEAKARLDAATAAAAAQPDDAAAKGALAAAESDYETAAQLAQSYDVVASTMKATPVAVTAPHTASAGIGSTAGRLGIAVAVGLLAGVIGALALDYARRSRETVVAVPEAAEPIDATPAIRRRRDAAGAAVDDARQL